MKTFLSFIFIILVSYFSNAQIAKNTTAINSTAENSTSNPTLMLDTTFAFTEGLQKIIEKGKWGVQNEKKQKLIAPQYEYLGWSDDPYWSYLHDVKALQSFKTIFFAAYEKILAYKKNNHWGFISTKGKILTPPQYESIDYFHQGISIVSQINENKQKIYGVLNTKLKVVIKPQYHYITPYHNYQVFVIGKTKTDSTSLRDKTFFGLITREGKTILPTKFTAVRHYNDYFAFKTQNNTWEIYDRQGIKAFNLNIQGIEDIKGIEKEAAIVKQNGKWGVMDKYGKLLIDIIYMDIYHKEGKTYMVLPFTPWKLLNSKNEIIKTFYYETLHLIRHDLYKYRSNGTYGILSENGDQLSPPIYQEIYPFKDEMTVVKKNEKYTVINRLAKELLPLWDSARIENNQYIAVRKISPKANWGIYNKQGRQIVPLEYQDIQVLDDKSFAVKKDSLWAYMDDHSLVLSPFIFQEIKPFVKDKAIVKYQGYNGIIDRKVNWVIDPVFDSLHILSSHCALFFTKNGYGLINLATKEIKAIADKIEFWGEGYIKVTFEGKSGLYNAAGENLIEVEYPYLSAFSKDSTLTGYKNGSYEIINKRGKIITRIPTYEDVGSMAEGLIPVKIKRKWGFVDAKGKLRIANRYDAVKPFEEGFAAIKMIGGWGFINLNEDLKIQPIYQEVRPFKKGVAMVKKNNKWGFIDKNGKELTSFNYERAEPLPKGWLVTTNNLQGYISDSGKEIISPKYDFIEILPQGDILVRKNKKWGIINEQGYDKLPIMYNFVHRTNSYTMIGLYPEWLSIKVNNP